MALKRFALRDSLFLRVMLILLCGLIAAQLTSLWLQWGERANVITEARGRNFVDRIADVVLKLESETPSHRASKLAELGASDLKLVLISAEETGHHRARRSVELALSERLGSEREIRSTNEFGRVGNMGGMRGGMPHAARQGMGSNRMRFAENSIQSLDVRLQDGQWLRILTDPEGAPPALPNALIMQLVLSFLIIVIVIMLAVRQLTKPLEQLTEAANSFGRDIDAPQLSEKGPREMRAAASAFNRMQERIKRLVTERSRALAAVSHDLRTPLTRLRLRTELVNDETLRDEMANDLNAMAAMLESTLNYLRGLQETEVSCAIDINALLQSLIDDERLLGREISLTGVATQPYVGRLSALRRALQNLVDNAIKYGQSAQLRIEDSQSALCLAVEDKGAGVPESDIKRLTEPYYRLDTARRAETGGSGLGLSIVNDIALMHGGQLQLANLATGGFSAKLILPRHLPIVSVTETQHPAT